MEQWDALVDNALARLQARSLLRATRPIAFAPPPAAPETFAGSGPWDRAAAKIRLHLDALLWDTSFQPTEAKLDRPDGLAGGGGFCFWDEHDLGDGYIRNFGKDTWHSAYIPTGWEHTHTLIHSLKHRIMSEYKPSSGNTYIEQSRPWRVQFSHHQATKAIGNLAVKNIFMLNRADHGESSSSSIPTGGNHHRGTSSAANHKPIVIFDTGAEVSVTGDENMFCPLYYEQEGFGLQAANGNGMTSNLVGVLNHEQFQMNHVYFSHDLGARTVISGPELDLLGYGYKCVNGICNVWDNETLVEVGKGHLVDGKYLMDYLNIPLNRAPVSLPEDPVPEVSVPEVPITGVPERRSAHVATVLTAVYTILQSFVSLFKRADAQNPWRAPL